MQPDACARLEHARTIAIRHGVTQGEIAIHVGASQSQVSRVLSGRGQRSTRLAEEICLYLERLEGGVSKEAVSRNTELMSALQVAWDGTAAHARALSGVIRSLAALKAAGPPPKRSRRGG